MNKLFVALVTTLSILVASLHAEIGKDQIAQMSLSLFQPYEKALAICKEKGFSHFIFKRISASGDKGQTLEFKGAATTETGTLIKETLELDMTAVMGSAIGKQRIEFEILCFHQAPNDPLAIDVEAIFKFIEQWTPQEPVEAIKGSTVREMTSLQELDAELAKAHGTVFLDCYSSHCPPCKMLAPKYEQYSVDLASQGIFLKINTDTVPESLHRFKIVSVPTLIVFRDKLEVERFSGLPSILNYFAQFKQ